MAPMRPADRSAADTDQLDDVIEKIETTLPRIHKMCRVQKKQKKSPTDRLPPGTASRFKELSEDPIINSEATEITEGPPMKINGAHDHKNQASA